MSEGSVVDRKASSLAGQWSKSLALRLDSISVELKVAHLDSMTDVLTAATMTVERVCKSGREKGS